MSPLGKWGTIQRLEILSLFLSAPGQSTYINVKKMPCPGPFSLKDANSDISLNKGPIASRMVWEGGCYGLLLWTVIIGL